MYDLRFSICVKQIKSVLFLFEANPAIRYIFYFFKGKKLKDTASIRARHYGLRILKLLRYRVLK